MPDVGEDMKFGSRVPLGRGYALSGGDRTYGTVAIIHTRLFVRGWRAQRPRRADLDRPCVLCRFASCI